MKIESRTYTDFMRLQLGGETNPSFASSSRSKLGFGVNAKTDEGRAMLHALAAKSDLVIENNSTGTMDKLGIGFDALQAVNPGLVMVSSQLMGSHGAWSWWRGYGPSTQPPGGLVHLWNYADRDEPAGSMSIYPDHVAGCLGAVASLAALLGRARDVNRGVHLEVAQVETVVGMLGDLIAAEGVEAGSVVPMGNRSEAGAPWGLYRCAGEEEWLAITCRDDTDWQGLVAAMGSPAWAADAALAGVDGRRARADEIDDHIREWTATRSKDAAAAACQAHGVPAAPMLTGAEQTMDAQFVARAFAVEIDQPGVGPLVLDGAAFRGALMEGPDIRPAPDLGEHTRQIARELLGLDRRRDRPSPRGRRPGDDAAGGLSASADACGSRAATVSSPDVGVGRAHRQRRSRAPRRLPHFTPRSRRRDRRRRHRRPPTHTVAVAEQHGAVVAYEPWRGDFATPRNRSLDLATGDWILSVDADERVRGDFAGARAFLDRRRRLRGLPGARSFPASAGPRSGSTGCGATASDIRFRGRIHESMVPAISAAADADGLRDRRRSTASPSTTSDDEGDRADKRARDEPLLVAELERHPDRAFVYDHLARVYEAAGDGDRAVDTWKRGIAVARARRLSHPDDRLLYIDLIHHLLADGDGRRRARGAGRRGAGRVRSHARRSSWPRRGSRSRPVVRATRSSRSSGWCTSTTTPSSRPARRTTSACSASGRGASSACAASRSATTLLPPTRSARRALAPGDPSYGVRRRLAEARDPTSSA